MATSRERPTPSCGGLPKASQLHFAVHLGGKYGDWAAETPQVSCPGKKSANFSGIGNKHIHRWSMFIESFDYQRLRSWAVVGSQSLPASGLPWLDGLPREIVPVKNQPVLVTFKVPHIGWYWLNMFVTNVGFCSCYRLLDFKAMAFPLFHSRISISQFHWLIDVHQSLSGNSDESLSAEQSDNRGHIVSKTLYANVRCVLTNHHIRT